MAVQIAPTPSPAALNTDPEQAATALGHLLRQAPEFEAYLKALKAVNDDLTVQKLGAQLRSHKSALQWGRDEDGCHAAELARLERELEDLSTVKEFHQAEIAVKGLFRAVEEIISREAGVSFAENAKRGGCCG